MRYPEILASLRTIDPVAFSFYTVVVATVLLVAVKLFTWMTTGVYRGTRSMKGKTVIVTGCNSGNYTIVHEIKKT